jgi:hypothetical protein
VSDAKGRVSGAKVQLDNQTKVTDASGVVNFAGVESGEHNVAITATGDAGFSTTVSLAAGQNDLVSYHLTKATVLPGAKMTAAVVAAGSLEIYEGRGGRVVP